MYVYLYTHTHTHTQVPQASYEYKWVHYENARECTIINDNLFTLLLLVINIESVHIYYTLIGIYRVTISTYSIVYL